MTESDHISMGRPRHPRGHRHIGRLPLRPGAVARYVPHCPSFALLTPGWKHSFLSAIGTLFVLGPVLYLASVHVVLRVRRSWIECTSPLLSTSDTSAPSPASASVAPQHLVRDVHTACPRLRGRTRMVRRRSCPHICCGHQRLQPRRAARLVVRRDAQEPVALERATLVPRVRKHAVLRRARYPGYTYSERRAQVAQD